MSASWSGACCASTRPLKGNMTKQQPMVLAGHHLQQDLSCQVQHISLNSRPFLVRRMPALGIPAHMTVSPGKHMETDLDEQSVPACNFSEPHQTH